MSLVIRTHHICNTKRNTKKSSNYQSYSPNPAQISDVPNSTITPVGRKFFLMCCAVGRMRPPFCMITCHKGSLRPKIARFSVTGTQVVAKSLFILVLHHSQKHQVCLKEKFTCSVSKNNSPQKFSWEPATTATLEIGTGPNHKQTKLLPPWLEFQPKTHQKTRRA